MNAPKCGMAFRNGDNIYLCTRDRGHARGCGFAPWRGAAEERTRIVAELRARAAALGSADVHCGAVVALLTAAIAIERGAHRAADTDTPPDASAEERRRIVADLRLRADDLAMPQDARVDPLRDSVATILDDLADRYERGDHLTPDTGAKP